MKHTKGHTDMTSPECIHFTNFVPKTYKSVIIKSLAVGVSIPFHVREKDLHSGNALGCLGGNKQDIGYPG
jgi:hypothetical protein